MGEFKDYMMNYTGHEQFNAVYTITIGELLEGGLFDWNMPELDWKAAAFDEEQYERVCNYFVERFYYREISIEPFAEWALILKRKLVYELMPKYRPLYERVKDGYAPFANEDEYFKSRIVNSKYPQTMLSGNSDYLTDGRDEENERIKEGNISEAMTKYVREFHGVDESLLDELESMFVCMYTANVNAAW